MGASMNKGSANGGRNVSRGFSHLLNHLKKVGFVKKSLSVHRAVRVAGVLLGLLVTTSVVRGDVFYVADEARLVKLSANGVPSVFIQEPDQGFQDPFGVILETVLSQSEL